MEAEQKRIDNLDEEAKLLGEPADLPTKAGPGSGPPSAKAADVFLRLPKGISPRAESFGDGLYRFARQSNSPYGRYYSPEEANNQPPPFQEVYVGVAVGGKAEEFQTKVLQAFGTTAGTPGKWVINSPGRGHLEFAWINFEDANSPPSAYKSFFTAKAGVHVAVIFRMPKDQAKSPTIKKGIDATLQTLVIGPEAEQERQRHAPPKPKK